MLEGGGVNFVIAAGRAGGVRAEGPRVLFSFSYSCETMAMNRGTMSVRVNPLKGNGIQTYCKITQYEYADGKRNKYTFSFGTGPQRYCMIVSIDGRDYHTAYIDRVDRLEKCSRGVKLTDIVDAMGKFVPLGLYAIKKMCPWVSRFTLKDDSKIVCDGVRGPSIGMAYDYLIKYNMTWYQKKFGAQLDGLVTGKEDANGDGDEKGIETLSLSLDGGKQVDVRVVKDSLMYQHLRSLEVLDQPCREFALLRDHFPELETFRDVYEASSSPRDFIMRVRAGFSDPASFCRGVSRWFDRYMSSLRILLFMDSWFIPSEGVVEPEGFAVGMPVKESVLNTYQGGKRGGGKRRGGGGTRRRVSLQGMVGGVEKGFGVAGYGEGE